jgi:hypothetical protein
MPAPNASYSITMRVQLDADPGGIGRLTTAVGRRAWHGRPATPMTNPRPWCCVAEVV